MSAWLGRGAFRGWPEMMLADYIADGLVETPEGFTLACDPEWEASNFAAQSHDPWQALQRLDCPVSVLKAEIGSPCRMSEDRRRLPHLTVGTVPGGTHFFPMLQADIARDVLFEAAV
jgi:hypothetical protein